MMKKKVLFVTRNYPPVKGGIEKYAYDFYSHLKEYEEVSLLANTKGKKNLIFFFIRVLFYILFKYDFTHVHLGDGVLSLFIPLIRFLHPKARISITIHALDITYNKYCYQRFIPRLVNKADKIVCVSSNTLDECIKRGIDKKKCLLIPNGINFAATPIFSKEELSQKLEVDLNNKVVLLSVGRLIKRKGITWFLNNVFPKLGDEYIFLIAGAGKERGNIEKTIKRKGLSKKVFLLGKVSEKMKFSLYEHADLFVMPNIHIEGDAEGFGIVLIEAASFGLPSVASNIEGIPDAVIDGKTGILVQEKDVNGFVEAIKNIHLKSSVVKKYAQKYNWDNLINRYLEEVF